MKKVGKISKISVLLVVGVLSLFFLIKFSFPASVLQPVKAEKGVLDLSAWDFNTSPFSFLNGEWDFFPSITELDPEKLPEEKKVSITVPSFWSSPLIPSEDAFQTVAYRLKVFLPAGIERIVLKTENIVPNYTLWINGEKVAGAGIVSLERKASRPGNSIYFDRVKDSSESLNLVVFISNYHNISGGLNKGMKIGCFDKFFPYFIKEVILQAIALGAICVMGIYTFMTFFMKPEKKDSLFLALISFCVLIFMGLKNEMLLLRFLPFLEGEVRSKLVFLVLVNIGGLLFFYSGIGDRNPIIPRVKKWILGYMIGGSLFVLFVPMHIHSLFALPMQLICVATLIAAPGIWWYFRDKGHRRFESVSIGFTVLASFFIVLCFLNENMVFPIQSISQDFMIFLIGFLLLRAKEFTKYAGQAEALADSHQELSRINRELTVISRVDSLTSVENRRSFDHYLESLFQSEKRSGKNIGLIMIDIDYFKNYNDYYGHQEGDRCLKKVAQVLKESLHRQEDFIARYGGEEFAVVLTDLDEQGAFRVAENLRQAVSRIMIPHNASPCSSYVTISLGFSVLGASREGADAALLLSQADRALYKAKNTGRNQVIQDHQEAFLSTALVGIE